MSLKVHTYVFAALYEVIQQGHRKHSSLRLLTSPTLICFFFFVLLSLFPPWCEAVQV